MKDMRTEQFRQAAKRHGGVILMFVLFFACPAGLMSQRPGFFDGEENLRIQIAEHSLNQYGEVYFSFVPAKKISMESLSDHISLTRRQEGSELFAFAGRKGFDYFLSTGLEFTVYRHPSGGLSPEMRDEVDVRNTNDWDFYPTYEAYLDIMQQFEDQHPGICKVFSIGESLEGRSLLFAKISDNVGTSEKEPLFLYTSSIHGNELTGYVLMLRLIDYLLDNYGSDPLVSGLVEHLEIWINPLANPDGTYASGNHTVAGATRFNAGNVDLNRNYPDPEDGPHPDGNDWQKETLEFMALADSVMFTMAANLHGGAEVCNYPWDTWFKRHPDDDWWQYVCRQYADTVHLYGPPGYLDDLDNGITNGYDWYTISGGRQDYMNYFSHCREFTLEISSIFIPPAVTLPDYWEYNYRSLLNYMRQATFGLRGTVTDSAGGNPLKAMVSIAGHDFDSSQVFSDPSSGFYCRPIMGGVYTVSFSSPGYKTRTFHGVQVVNGQVQTLDVALAPGNNGIPHNPEENVFTAGPLPAAGFIILEYNKEKPETYSLKMYDMAGRVALECPPELYSGEGGKIIPVGRLSGGIYLLTLSSAGGETIVLKIIKE
ncbi:MAG: carboxypeptidase regulatory-like domain-containing protein [Bacteroidales bacterium]|nr:carboxypeptidase regulatory-like domain-containing protein [Bacteroidales bacterium]